MAVLAASEASGEGHETAQGEVVITGSAAAGTTSVVGDDAEEGEGVIGVVGVDDAPQPDRRMMAATARRLATQRSTGLNRCLEGAPDIASSFFI